MNLEYKGANYRGRVEWEDKDHGLVMEDWQAVIYRTTVEDVERRIGRPLTKEEARTIHWLTGFEQSTVNVIKNLITAAHEHGYKGLKIGETE